MKDNNVILEVKDLHKSFGEQEVLKGISTEVNRGDVIAIIGPSGCGKSTFLRSLNLLETPTSGQILFEGTDLTDKSTDINVTRQKIGMVFQQFNLFANMTIKANIMLAPVKLGVMTKDEASKKADELLTRIGLLDKADAYPAQLSGGMKQRVGIAMSMTARPKLLLADEPTSALDVTIQAEVVREMKKLREQYQAAIILVTHNMGVASYISDKIGVMCQGKLVEFGKRDDVIFHPKHEYTKGLIKSIPKLNVQETERLIPIEGQPVDLLNPPAGCPFAPRCANCMKICLREMPPKTELSDTHYSQCWLLQKEEFEKGEISCE